MKKLLAIAVAVLGLTLSANLASAKDAEAKQVSGKSGCATCEGVTADSGHPIMLTDKEGNRWVLIGDSEDYKAAHKARKAGKTMTATLAGEPTAKKDADGKEYKEAKISAIKIEA